VPLALMAVSPWAGRLFALPGPAVRVQPEPFQVQVDTAIDASRSRVVGIAGVLGVRGVPDGAAHYRANVG